MCGGTHNIPPDSVAQRVYPRVCGGTAVKTFSCASSNGLSPRVRGNPIPIPSEAGRSRSIPACAGEPAPGADSFRNARVYPRVCGGTSLVGGPPGGIHGLSPRVRGNPRVFRPRLEGPGSIPACAGEPFPTSQWRIPPRVYPRVCGGTQSVVSGSVGRAGLSPRVRGNHPCSAGPPLSERSIPACAGEPSVAIMRALYVQVYPRVCGGTHRLGDAGGLGMGLSPRVRGNRLLVNRQRVVQGSIPACAGEPVSGGGHWCGRRVYPRVCGGTANRRFLSRPATGLSPRVRGNLLYPGYAGRPGRSIPACAGEPRRPDNEHEGGEVYPRVCGGTRRRGYRHDYRQGLSPRVRGNHPAGCILKGHRRSIPACAGEPAGV